jgi:hypothetical protein
VEEETKTMSDEKKAENDDRPAPGEDIYAIFANRFYIVATEAFTRIAFGESATGIQEFYRMAVVLPTEDAKALARSLSRLIAEVEEEDAGPSDQPQP